MLPPRIRVLVRTFMTPDDELQIVEIMQVEHLRIRWAVARGCSKVWLTDLGSPALTAVPPVWLSFGHDGSEGSPV